MKITKQELKEIIKEEVSGLLSEIYPDPHAAYEYDPEAGMPREISPHESPIATKMVGTAAATLPVGRVAKLGYKGLRALWDLFGGGSKPSETPPPAAETLPVKAAEPSTPPPAEKGPTISDIARLSSPDWPEPEPEPEPEPTPLRTPLRTVPPPETSTEVAEVETSTPHIDSAIRRADYQIYKGENPPTNVMDQTPSQHLSNFIGTARADQPNYVASDASYAENIGERPSSDRVQALSRMLNRSTDSVTSPADPHLGLVQKHMIRSRMSEWTEAVKAWAHNVHNQRFPVHNDEIRKSIGRSFNNLRHEIANDVRSMPKRFGFEKETGNVINLNPQEQRGLEEVVDGMIDSVIRTNWNTNRSELGWDRLFQNIGDISTDNLLDWGNQWKQDPYGISIKDFLRKP